jgi:hypothetical protein
VAVHGIFVTAGQFSVERCVSEEANAGSTLAMIAGSVLTVMAGVLLFVGSVLLAFYGVQLCSRCCRRSFTH